MLLQLSVWKLKISRWTPHTSMVALNICFNPGSGNHIHVYEKKAMIILFEILMHYPLPHAFNYIAFASVFSGPYNPGTHKADSIWSVCSDWHLNTIHKVLTVIWWCRCSSYVTHTDLVQVDILGFEYI